MLSAIGAWTLYLPMMAEFLDHFVANSKSQ
jgi:hypothetical protein